MEISQHIKNLLKSNDIVILSGFGAFETNQLSAKFDPETKTISPPIKIVTFNQTVQEDTGLLVKYMAEQEHISSDNAREQINEYVKTIKTKLSEGQVIEFIDLGSFSQEADGTINFSFLSDDNLLLDSFGLPTVSIVGKTGQEISSDNLKQKIEPETKPKTQAPKKEPEKIIKPLTQKPIKKENKPVSVDKSKKKRIGLKVFLIFLALVAVFLTAVYFFKPDLWAKGYDFSAQKLTVVKHKISQLFNKEGDKYEIIDEIAPDTNKTDGNTTQIVEDNNDENKSEDVNETAIKNETTVNNTPVNNTKKETVENQVIEDNSKVTTGVNGKYYIIVGSVVSEKEAKNEQKRFSSKGISTEIIHVPTIKRYRISLGEFNSIKAAQEYYSKIQSEHGTIEAWVWEK